MSATDWNEPGSESEETESTGETTPQEETEASVESTVPGTGPEEAGGSESVIPFKETPPEQALEIQQEQPQPEAPRQPEPTPPETPEKQAEPQPKFERLASLDALRGFDMFFIIGAYWIVKGLVKATDSPIWKTALEQMQHVRWEGFHFEDIIMPLFLFIVGVAMPFSFAKRLGRGDSKAKLYAHIIYRVIVLFILGMVVQGNLLAFDLSKLHIYCNTLQAIAAGYLISAIIMLNFRTRGQIISFFVLILAFWGAMMLIPVPNVGAGVLTEEGNLAIYIDKLILGRFQDGTTYTWILSSLTFGATTLLGVFAGQILRSKYHKLLKFIFLVILGAACLGSGWAWGHIFPIIKHLWTSSFVLYSGGMCLLLLALFYLIIDICKLRFLGFFFIVIGMNAIFVYVASHLFDFRIIGDIFIGTPGHGLQRFMGNWDFFVEAVVGFMVTWLILYWMYRKKTFIKI